MLACLCAFPAAALQLRPDRDEAEYLELATRYTSAVSLSAHGGNGALVAPRWILTSANVGKRLKESGTPVSVGQRRHEVQAIFLDGDVALVFLLQPVVGIEPFPLYRRDDEAGKAVAIVAPPRAGINTVDRVEARRLALKVKPLDEASDLQAVAEARDSGAPLYVEVDDAIHLAGIQVRSADGWDTYARVSTLANWIDETMGKAALAEANRRP